MSTSAVVAAASSSGAAANAAASGGTHSGKFSCRLQAMQYVDHALSTAGVFSGMKALLCDEETKNTLSIVYTQHQLLQKEVVLVELLGKLDRSAMPYLKCVILCRPTSQNFSDIAHELAHPHYAEYALFFTDVVEMDQLQSIANSDAKELVRCVEEVYLDTTPLSDSLCAIPLVPSAFSSGRNQLVNPLVIAQWDNSEFARTASGLCSLMLMTKRRPVVRFRAGSKVAERIASDVSAKVKFLNSSFPDLRNRECVLLVLDRVDDPLTPLLTQWTYEAMVHNIIGIEDGNRVVVDEASAGGPTDRDHVLCPDHDAFFAEHRFKDWGEVCLGVRDLVETYKSLNNIDRSTASLDEIKGFLGRFPEAKQQSAQMTRHTSIVTQLAGEVQSRSLTRLSVVEQDMVANSAVSDHSKAVLELVQDPAVEMEDALRLVILYTLRYEKSSSRITEQLKTELDTRGCAPHKIHLIDKIIEYAGASRRSFDVYQSNTNNFFKTVVKSLAQFSGDVENVLTQHEPLLKKILTRLYNGTLDGKRYPAFCPSDHAGGSSSASFDVDEYQRQATSGKVADVIVYVAGGVTYEESLLVDRINSGLVENKTETKLVDKMKIGGEEVPPLINGMRVTLCGPAVVNSAQFLASLP